MCLENGYRIEVLILLRKLERLDKDHINEDERQEAEEVNSFSFLANSLFREDQQFAYTLL